MKTTNNGSEKLNLLGQWLLEYVNEHGKNTVKPGSPSRSHIQRASLHGQ
jgi:hypothetical protein